MPINAPKLARMARLGIAMPVLILAGCVSLGSEPPSSLLTLTPETSAPAGSTVSASGNETVALYLPTVPAELDVLRVPVRIDDASLAYLKDAVWVERPALLFQRLLAETIRVRGERLVLDGGDPAASGGVQLRGQISRFGYDASRSAAVVRFDARRRGANGEIEIQRFESIEEGVPAEAAPVGAALNRAANDVARQVADWIAE